MADATPLRRLPNRGVARSRSGAARTLRYARPAQPRASAQPGPVLAAEYRTPARVSACGRPRGSVCKVAPHRPARRHPGRLDPSGVTKWPDGPTPAERPVTRVFHPVLSTWELVEGQWCASGPDEIGTPRARL